MKSLLNKHIVLGITGGIAAYKSADLARRLKEAGALVRVVMTLAAKEFITPLTMQAVSGNLVHENLLDEQAEAAMGHIELARWADVLLIAPTSADFIAKLAQGHGDDLLSTLCLATKAPIAIAPAMNQQMWKNLALQQNVEILRKRKVIIFGPDYGEQACGDVGFGRMLEPATLVEQVASLFASQLMSGVRVLITAGPTQEPIDPVRFLSNHSSGKMGYAIAQAAIEMGASVVLVSGPTHLDLPAGAQIKKVLTAEEMYQTVLTQINECDIFIAAAAVADYRCASIAPTKMIKAHEKLTLELVRNPDIVATVAALPNKPFVVGFAAQTEDVILKATQKMQAKGLDMIVANLVGVAGSGFMTDENAVTVIGKKGSQDIPLATKSHVARKLITIIVEQYSNAKKNPT
jgi:phosphopantothenoylcysteine decarboxylase/phosphopantothenate--cysteine ligase